MSTPSPQWRTDALACPLNEGKRAKVTALVRALRKTAGRESHLQWHRFYRGGWQGFESMATKGWTRPWVNDGSLSTTHAQMVMAQVAGQLKGHWGNVKNTYTRLVAGSSLPPEIRHQLHSINVRSAWFLKSPVVVKQDVWEVSANRSKPVRKKNDVVVADDIRALARCLIRRAMAQHRIPHFRHYQFQLDQRTVFLQTPHCAHGFDQWLVMGTLTPGERIALPVQTHPHFLARQDRAGLDQALARAGNRSDELFQAIHSSVAQGPAHLHARQALARERAKGISGLSDKERGIKLTTIEKLEKQIASTHQGLKEAPERNPHASRFYLAKSVRLILSSNEQSLTIAVATDMGASFEHSVATYQPRMGALGLDMGMNTLFGTSVGDLLGRGWLRQIERYDRLLQAIARHRQRLGLKTASDRYRKIVARLRGFLKTEIHRILNRLVHTHAPSQLVMEEPGFYRNPKLSRRLNRLMSNMGASIVSEKLKDIEARFGITTVFVPAAYSSQTCSSCGYVDKRNRIKQDTFHCKFCTTQLHADVNAPRNLLARRSGQSTKTDSTPSSSRPEPRHSRKHLLQGLVSQFLERYPRPRGGPADPRWFNPYFKAWADEVRSSAAALSPPSSCCALV